MINLLNTYTKEQRITLKRMHGQSNVKATVLLAMEDSLLVQVDGYSGTTMVYEYNILQERGVCK
ncbi:hypothetical protein [Brevibacillus sp. NRS-1366]|uniref:hypothetical protein n=1 Tax=Brevibacillus sp. NRS-1366 TaxID=3233899 RepID=UPI003D24F0F1